MNNKIIFPNSGAISDDERRTIKKISEMGVGELFGNIHKMLIELEERFAIRKEDGDA